MGFWNRAGSLADTAAVDWDFLGGLSRKGELLAALKAAGAAFAPDDLEEMLCRYAKKLAYVPRDYADALLCSARVQIIDGYHRMMTAELVDVHANVRLAASWKDFANDAVTRSSGKRLAGLKYLIAAYTIYIAEEPAHPAGTPFPGGYAVELHEGVYYCPVRAVQGEVDSTLCRFCPAVQSRERDLVLTKKEREFVEREEKLENYFFNYHG